MSRLLNQEVRLLYWSANICLFSNLNFSKIHQSYRSTLLEWQEGNTSGLDDVSRQVLIYKKLPVVLPYFNSLLSSTTTAYLLDINTAKDIEKDIFTYFTQLLSTIRRLANCLQNLNFHSYGKELFYYYVALQHYSVTSIVKRFQHYRC